MSANYVLPGDSENSDSAKYREESSQNAHDNEMMNEDEL